MPGSLFFVGRVFCKYSAVKWQLFSSAALRRCVAMVCCGLFCMGAFFLTSCSHVPEGKFSVDESLTAQIIPQENHRYSIFFELGCKEELPWRSFSETSYIRIQDAEAGKWAEYHVSEGDKLFMSSAIIQEEKVECEYGFGIYAKVKIQKIDAGRVFVIGLIADVRRNKDGSVLRKVYPLSFVCKLNERIKIYSFASPLSASL